MKTPTFLLPVLLLLALLATQPAFAQHAGHGKVGSRVELGASAVFDAKGVLWAVYKEGQHVMLKRSEDGGVRWGDALAVNAKPEPIEASGDSRPKIALGPRGELYITWTQPLGKFHTGHVRFARSLDGGATFSVPSTVNSDRRQITHRFDAVAVDGTGRVYVAWLDNRDGPTTLWFAVSSDQGATFSPDRGLAAGSCECCRIALLAGKEGAVVFWRHVFPLNVRDHALLDLKPDGTAGELRRATYDDWRVEACPHHGPSLARDGSGALHGAWYSGTPGKEGVYYGRLVPDGVDDQRRVGGDTAAHADIAASGNRIAMAWKEFDGKLSLLRARWSDDGGTSWRQAQLASSGGSTDQPKVLVRGAGFVVLWNTSEQPLRVVPVP